MRSGLFAVRAEHEREKEAEEYDRGDAGGSGFQPSRDGAEHSSLFCALYGALCQTAPEPRDGHRNARGGKIFHIAEHSRGFQHQPEQHESDEDARGGHLRLVDEQLTERAERPAHRKNFKISQKNFHLTHFMHTSVLAAPCCGKSTKAPKLFSLSPFNIILLGIFEITSMISFFLV